MVSTFSFFHKTVGLLWNAVFGDFAIQGNIADLLPTAVKCTAIHISPPCSPFHTAGPGHIIKITAAFERAHNIKTETFIENIGIDIAVKTGVGIADNHFIVRRVGESAGTVQFDEHLASGSRVDTPGDRTTFRAEVDSPSSYCASGAGV